MDILERDDPIYRNFKQYRNRVTVRSNKTYELFEAQINPTGHTRGKSGTTNAYQLDHIISVKQGFEQGISIEKMSSKENLQMLPWLENNQKYSGKK